VTKYCAKYIKLQAQLKSSTVGSTMAKLKMVVTTCFLKMIEKFSKKIYIKNPRKNFQNFNIIYVVIS